MTALLSVEAVSKRFRGLTAVDAVSFATVASGSSVGRSGLERTVPFWRKYLIWSNGDGGDPE